MTKLVEMKTGIHAMLKYIQVLIIISSFLIGSDINAQWVQTNGPCGGHITALARIGNRLFAGSNNAGVFVSSDNGKNWVQTSGPDMQRHIASLAVIDSELYAGTQDCGVYYSSNFGESWIQIGPLPVSAWQSSGADCLIVNGKKLYAGTDQGVYQTTNQGVSWSMVNPSYPLTGIQSMAIKDTMLYAATGYGIYRSSINNSYWYKVFSFSGNIYNNYVLAAKDSFLFAGTRNGMFVSTNNGNNWIKSPLGINDNQITALTFIGQDLLAGTYKSGAYISANYGTSWKYLGLKDEEVMAFVSHGTNLYAGTYPHGILVSINKDTSWTVTSLINSSVKALASSGNSLFAGAGGLFISDSNRTDWAEIRNRPRENFSPSYFAFNGKMLAAASSSFLSSNEVCISTDNGINWTPVPSWTLVQSVRDRISALALKDKNILVGTYEGMYILNEGTAEWIRPKSGLPDRYMVYNLTISGKNIIAAIVDSTKGNIYLSSDDGKSWNSIWPDDFYPVALASTDNCIFVAARNKGVFLSTDNGNNWTLKNNGLENVAWTESGLDNHIVTQDSNIFFQNMEAIYLSTNYGDSWRKISPALSKYTDINSITIFNSNLYMGTEGEGVWMHPLKELLTSVESPLQSIPSEFKLEQNFPNPFNPETQISFSIPQATDVRLKAFDILGKEVYSLVNEAKPAGSYSVEFDGSSLPSGIYIYTIQAGQFRDSKKLLLLK